MYQDEFDFIIAIILEHIKLKHTVEIIREIHCDLIY